MIEIQIRKRVFAWNELFESFENEKLLIYFECTLNARRVGLVGEPPNILNIIISARYVLINAVVIYKLKINKNAKRRAAQRLHSVANIHPYQDF